MKIIWFFLAYIKKKSYLCSRNNKDNNSLKPKSRKGIKIMKTINEINAFYAANGYELEQTLEGQYRLVYNSEYDGISHYVTEDPACEDTYDKELAAVIFYEAAVEHFNKGVKTVEISNSILSAIADKVEELGITMTCNEDMEITISNPDYAKLCTIMDKADIYVIDEKF